MPTELALLNPLLAPAPAATSAPAAAPARARRSPAFRRPSMAWLLFLVAVLPAYAPVLGGQFFWDDNYLALGDPLIRSPRFFLEAFRHTLFGDSSNFYRPTQTLTYMFDYWCWGLEPFGFHLTNVLIHACNGFVLFLLLRRVLPVLVPAATTTPRPATDRGALGIALLWALHPVHSAAVAYVSGRADSLAMTFCLTAWLACERALEAGRPAARVGWAAGAFVSLLLGLCSKEIAFVWLVLFGCWLFALRPPRPGTSSRAALKTKLTVIGVGLLVLLCYVGLRQLPPVPPTPPPYPPMPARWVLMLRALGDYSRLMVFPDQLYMERQVFAAPGLENPPDPIYYHALAAVGAFTLAAFVAGACLPGCGRALRRTGAGWFLIGFLPVSNLFLLNASVAEHWLYLPSIGFLLFLAGVALDVPWARLSFLVRPEAAVAAVLVAVAALGGRTWLRAHDWLDGLTFYRQTIRDGGDTPRMREGLALTYLARGEPTAAAALLGDLSTRYPHLFSTRVNFASAQHRAGRVEEARAAFERIAADLLDPANARGGAQEYAATIRSLDRLEPSGDPAWADLRHRLLSRAAGRFPPSWEMIRIGIADCEKAGDLPTALTLATSFSKAHWWHAAARLELGRLLAASGRSDEALEVWRLAARYDIRDADAPSSAATLCLTQGRLDEALAWQRDAVHRRPDSLRQHLLLARVLELQGRTADADHERELARQIAKTSQG